jgi:hypothetical protein
MSFADGHAEKHRWVDPRTMVAETVRTDDDAGVPPAFQQIFTPDSKDGQWLEQRGRTHFH